ncbi:LysR family transcriptional regulator [Rodentibacter caecimuris]|uniref:LysR family transcriptional regulator n=1 Tax=Rodentibacter caecimuris TaxID=1796644 RepID=A0AAJ3K3U3_9PAST|nr:LysR family transcriptional regulator [Rodentibacter heylii]AOF52818.1 Transcriptional regulator [Pasteurellaceae bacterium NI1060]OOF71537.1 LysR family transcriptional regulator [Rodentibacter heylii]OOF73870.1 LysR family transcriptional regulator [Rodentibacter heylii]OOF76944.1 LysR family transcriptional regulator [Rodentibacter heylii]
MNNRFETLKVFCSLAETLQFKETANRLAISPPVVTRLIAELEDYLGESLFQCNTRQVHLTDFGEQFLPQAQQLLVDSEKLFIPNKQRAYAEMNGIVRITAPSWRINDEILAKLLTALSPYPNLIIDWRDDMSKLDSVSHRIDIGIRIGPKSEPNFIVRKIADIGDVLVAAPSLLERLGEPKSLEDLEQSFPFAALINVNTGRPWHFPLTPERTLKPHCIAFQSNNIYSKLQVVLQGSAVGLVSDFIAQPYLQTGELHQLFPEIKIQKWQLFLYRPYETVTPKRVLKVFEELERILRQFFTEQ